MRSDCTQNMACFLKALCIIGGVIWAIPLVWYIRKRKEGEI